jgi:hypothetical protein
MAMHLKQIEYAKRLRPLINKVVKMIFSKKITMACGKKVVIMIYRN